MTGYVRKDTTNNIADGNVINAADLDAEFDGVQAAFNASTGHKHDGTASEGATINALGPTQDVTISATLVAPKTTNFVDIGSSGLKFKDMFLAGNASIGGTLAVTGVATFTAQPILSSLTASRAVFSDGSKGLVSNAITGTGNVVMSASPTLTGTIGGASLTLSSLTSGRVTYAGTSGLLQDSSNLTFDGTTLTAAGLAGPLNGTVGATTPTTGVFTTVTARAAATQDSVILQGRAGGTSSYGVTFTPTTLTASRTLTLPDASGTILQSGTTVTTGQGGTGLTSFTANGVVYASSSSALTTGSALVFDGTNLGVGTSSPVNKLVVSNAGAAGFEVNPSDASGVALASYNRSGAAYANSIYYASNQIFCTGGTTEGMRLTSTGLGIGTSSPGYKLDVEKSSDGTIGYFRRIGATVNPALTIYANETGNTVGFGTDYAGATSPAITFSIAASEKMRLDSSGNLGLGVTPSAWGSSYKAIQIPSGALSAFGTSVVSLYQNGYDSGTGAFKYVNSLQAAKYDINQGAHYWYIAPSGTAGNAITFTQAMTLDASGNLGIGTSSPTQKLNVVGIGLFEGASQGNIIIQKTGTNGVSLFSDAAGKLAFYDQNAGITRLTLDASGNLGIGTTSPGAKLDVNGNIFSGAVGSTQRNITLATTGGSVVIVSHSTGDFNGDLYAAFNYNGGQIGSITQNSTTGVLYNITSDYRLKTVIGPVANAGQRIDALQPVEYTWNSNGSRTRGFLAHEFQDVYPNSVTGAKDAVDADGKPVYQNMQASTSEVIADLVAEIQSLRIRIAQLENKL
jgi:hypothetical protein